MLEKKRLILILLSLICQFLVFSNDDLIPTREVNINEKFNIVSQWVFTPYDGEFDNERKYYKLNPMAAWQFSNKDLVKYNGIGWYHSYYTFIGSNDKEKIGLSLPLSYGAYEIYINNKLLYYTHSFNEENMKTHFGTIPVVIEIPKDFLNSDKNLISLRVSPFSGWGGFNGFLRIGSYEKLFDQWVKRLIKDVSIGFISLFLFVYFIIHYIFRKKEKYNLLFSFLSLSVGVFTIGYFGTWFYLFNFSWAYWVLTFIGGISMYLLVLLFIHSFYNLKFNLVSKAFIVFYTFLNCFVIFEYLFTFKILFFMNYFYLIFNLSFILLVSYLFYVAISSVKKELKYSKIMLLSIGLLGLSFIYSMLCFSNILQKEPIAGEGFFAMVIVFTIVLAKRFAQTHSDLELSHALNLELNSTLENKVNYRTRELNLRNKEVTESIEYAALIQNSILPSNDSLTRSLSDFFVCWKPKGIVGGDFYWFNSKGDDFLIAIVDCTGHGVPGAMLTMTATSVLERVVVHINRTNPAKILNEMNKILKGILQREDTDYVTDDGLDIGLCYYNSKDKLLTYSGSRIRLHVVEDGYLREFKGDSQGIGYERSKEEYEYTNHEIKVSRDLSFYMTTDGYLDQSGGDFEFGFGWSKYKRLLVENHRDDMGTQLVKLEEALDRYQKDFEQRDDITLLGFKVKIDD